MGFERGLRKGLSQGRRQGKHVRGLAAHTVQQHEQLPYLALRGQQFNIIGKTHG
jgi:hypothetical protein